MIVYIDEEESQSKVSSIPEKDLAQEIRKVELEIIEKKKRLIDLKNEQTKRLIEMGID